MTLNTEQILRQLVGFPTVSRDSNLPLIDWTRNYLADLGIESFLVPDAVGRKANLFALIGPGEPGGLGLSGHTDVVPTDEQEWHSDPFVLTQRDARLYARGACDMKGFIAAVLAKVPAWRSLRLARPVHLMFSYDEEVGCLGAPSMIAAARAQLPQPAAVIVGEPTSMRLANAHKGICVLHTAVTGIAAHSSLTHQGASAVMLAAELISGLHRLSRKLMERVEQRSSTVEPPYTSVSVNQIRGGTASNILAAECEFTWDIRTIPGETPADIREEFAALTDQLLADLKKEGKVCRIRTTVHADVPALLPEGGVAETLVAQISGDREPTGVPFASEAGQFQSAGWSTVVCGPGSIEQAHKPDEFVEQSELAACERFLDKLVAQQCLRP